MLPFCSPPARNFQCYLSVCICNDVSGIQLVFVLFLLFGTGSHYVALAGLKLTILLPPPPEYWDYRCEPPYPAPASGFDTLLSLACYCCIEKAVGEACCRVVRNNEKHLTASLCVVALHGCPWKRKRSWDQGRAMWLQVQATQLCSLRFLLLAP
jgi:hypothetical protein